MDVLTHQGTAIIVSRYLSRTVAYIQKLCFSKLDQRLETAEEIHLPTTQLPSVLGQQVASTCNCC